MKKFVILFFVLALALGTAGVAAAQTVPAPGGPFNSAFRVQNLESTVATCSYKFYNAAGAEALSSDTATVQPGDALYVYVPTLTLASGSYSAVVSCDKQIAAVVNFSDSNSGASHSGIDTPALVWYAPGIYDNYYNFYSDIVVQNAGTAATKIQLDIYEAGNPTAVYHEEKLNVPVNASVSFSQEGLTQLANNVSYSAKITGDGPIAPIVNIYGRASADNQLYSYNAFASGSLTAYVPLLMKNYYGYNTALVIQNMGSVDANVTVDYTNGFSADYTIAPGAAESIYTPGVAGLPAGNTLYGATITSSQNVAVLVNESNAYNRAASYTGFAAGATTVRSPIVEKSYYRYNSSITCQNVGTAAATMSISYAGITGTSTSPSAIAIGATYLFYQPTDPLLATVSPNWVSSATITSAQPIVCVVNQDQNMAPESTTAMDQLYAYEGIAP